MERIRAIALRMVDRVVPCAIKTFARKFANDWTMNLASMLAYSLSTAIFPLLLFILSIAALLLQPFVQAHIDSVVAAITAVLPRPVQSLIDVKALLNSLVAITGPLAVISFASSRVGRPHSGNSNSRPLAANWRSR